MGRARRAAGDIVTLTLFVAAVAPTLSTATGCADPCCTTDSFPINLLPRGTAEPGGLVASARYPNGDVGGVGADTFRLSIDTGTPLNFFRRQSEPARIVLRNFDILDAQPPVDRVEPVVRGKFRAIEALPLNLDATGPDAVLGGALLRNFSVQFDFAKPSLTFWSRQGASDEFLTAAGFAVIHFGLEGGGELTAQSRPDFLGLSGPVDVPPTRVVLRACGGAAAFDPDASEPERCCKRGDEVVLATGASLALVLATGVGPLVLSRSAWDRLAAVQQTPPPAPAPGDALPIPSLAAPLVDVLWSTLPRLALVNQELDDATNQGPCVDLGRARRLEWLERHQPTAAVTVTSCALLESGGGGPSSCTLPPQPCDTDPRDSTKAQSAAAYVEVGENIPVAIMPDSTPFLQGLRAEIRPEGPEIDGLIGANILAHTTVEVDYKNSSTRTVIGCSPDATRATCWTSPRCPRLSNAGDSRACFGLCPRRQTTVCAPSSCE